jgi:hypothetical protein
VEQGVQDSFAHVAVKAQRVRADKNHEEEMLEAQKRPVHILRIPFVYNALYTNVNKSIFV